MGTRELIQQGAHDLRLLTRSHALWMGWNLFLALVPLALALRLFRERARHGLLWWLGLALFVLFLPNAPYVLTDVIHLFDDIRRSRSDLQILGVYLPLYVAFFAVGTACYVVAVERARRHATRRWSWRAGVAVEAALHLLSAVGVFFGRVVRLNSWQVFTRPQEVLGALDWLIGPVPVLLVLITAVVLATLSAASRLLAAGLRTTVRDRAAPTTGPALIARPE